MIGEVSPSLPPGDFTCAGAQSGSESANGQRESATVHDFASLKEQISPGGFYRRGGAVSRGDFTRAGAR